MKSRLARVDERERWGRWVLVSSIAAGIGLAAFGATRTTWPEQRFVILYVAPTLPAAGLWIRERLRGYRPGATAAYVIDAVVFLLAVPRSVFGYLPFSGHMLFFTYSLLTTRAIPYRLVALAIVLMTTWFKLVTWRDPVSWSVGLGAGVLFAAAHAAAQRAPRRAAREVRD